jgi:hypothetical protein
MLVNAYYKNSGYMSVPNKNSYCTAVFCKKQEMDGKLLPKLCEMFPSVTCRKPPISTLLKGIKRNPTSNMLGR